MIIHFEIFTGAAKPITVEYNNDFNCAPSLLCSDTSEFPASQYFIIYINTEKQRVKNSTRLLMNVI